MSRQKNENNLFFDCLNKKIETIQPIGQINEMLSISDYCTVNDDVNQRIIMLIKAKSFENKTMKKENKHEDWFSK